MNLQDQTVYASVKSAEVLTRDYVDKQGNSKTLRLQKVALHFIDGKVYMEEVLCQRNGNPYPVGNYLVSPDSFTQDRYGRSQFRLVLGAAIAATAAVKAA